MNDAPIDLTVFTELQEATGREFAAELVSTFLEEAPGMIADLQQAAAAGDADGFRRAAHSIKSNANIFGASALANLSRDMELSGLAEFGHDFNKLEAEFERAQSALRSLLDG